MKEALRHLLKTLMLGRGLKNAIDRHANASDALDATLKEVLKR